MAVPAVDEFRPKLLKLTQSTIYLEFFFFLFLATRHILIILSHSFIEQPCIGEKNRRMSSFNDGKIISGVPVLSSY